MNEYRIEKHERLDIEEAKQKNKIVRINEVYKR